MRKFFLLSHCRGDLCPLAVSVGCMLVFHIIDALSAGDLPVWADGVGQNLWLAQQ